MIHELRTKRVVVSIGAGCKAVLLDVLVLLMVHFTPRELSERLDVIGGCGWRWTDGHGQSHSRLVP